MTRRHAASGAKRGPRPIGDRIAFSVMIERRLLEAAEDIAEQDDLAVGRVINRLLAQALDQPAPPYSLPPEQATLLSAS